MHLAELAASFGKPVQYVETASEMDLSPFQHSPLLPIGSGAVVSLVALPAVAALLAAVGYLGWRRRDLLA